MNYLSPEDRASIQSFRDSPSFSLHLAGSDFSYLPSDLREEAQALAREMYESLANGSCMKCHALLPVPYPPSSSTPIPEGWQLIKESEGSPSHWLCSACGGLGNKDSR